MKSSRLNALVLDNSLHYTGAFKSIFTLTRVTSGIQFYYGVPGKSTVIGILKQNNISYFGLSFIEVQRNWKVLVYIPMLIWNSVKILRIIKRVNISIIHVNDLYNMCGVMVKMFFPPVKLIYHIRLLPNSYVKPFYKVWQKLILYYADEIICVSYALRKHWPMSEKIHVLHDSMNASERHPLRQEFSSKNIKFLYLANYINGKGQEAALQAFSSIIKTMDKVTLVFAGSSMGLEKNRQFERSLKQMALMLGISKYVTFKDFVEDVELEIKEADIFLNFSESESFSMTCLEALYFGTPCIATASGGPEEIIVHGESGLLVPLHDINAMSDSMIKLATDRDLRRRFSENGRIRARGLFNSEEKVSELIRIYSKTVNF